MEGLLFDRLRIYYDLRINLTTLIRLIMFGDLLVGFNGVRLVFFFLFFFDGSHGDRHRLVPLILLSFRFLLLLVYHRRLHRSLKLELTVLRLTEEGFCRLLFVRGYFRGLGVGDAGSANDLFGLAEFQLFLLLVFGVAGLGGDGCLLEVQV